MLDELRSLGVVVWLNHEGQLAFDGSSDALNDALLVRMKANKVGLLAEVRESNTRARAESLRPIVVNLNHETFDVRIDRRGKWGNPFPMNKAKSNRKEVIAKFREWLPNQQNLIGALHELQGKRIGCHCAPRQCHGDVIAEFVVAALHEQFEREFVESPKHDGAFDNCPECGPSYQLETVEDGLECPKCSELIWRFEGGSTIRADVESFDEVPLASVPQCFVCEGLCDRVNGLGLWYCSRCDPLAKTRERKTTDALKVRRRWGRD